MYGCLPGLFAVLLFFLLFIVVTILRVVFAARRTVRQFMHGGRDSSSPREDGTHSAASGSPKSNRGKHQGKHFGSDEGIYIDFEEVP